MSLCSGSVCELNLGDLFSCLDDVILMSEAVCEYEIASCVYKVNCCIVALLTFGNVCLDDALNAKVCASFLCSVDEVEVVS